MEYACGCNSKKQNAVSVSGNKLLMNGKPFLAKGLRCSNALISERSTNELINNLDLYNRYGVNSISVYIMGSRYGDVKGYMKDGNLDSQYAERLARIIEQANQRSMMVLVGCLYWGHSKAKYDEWTQADAERAIENTALWLKINNYRNVILDIDNEGMAHVAKGFDIEKLIKKAKDINQECPVSYNYFGAPPEVADLGVHFSDIATEKPYIESEGVPENAPGGYWNCYSKERRRENCYMESEYYNYIRIGVYTDDMKEDQIARTRKHLDHGRGYMLASTWLQCVPPYGPNYHPGGYGSAENPGIRWWLEFLHDVYGPYCP